LGAFNPSDVWLAQTMWVVSLSTYNLFGCVFSIDPSGLTSDDRDQRRSRRGNREAHMSKSNKIVVTVNGHINRKFDTVREARAFVAQAERGGLGVVVESVAVSLGRRLPASR
jgi:hypothetical protein